MFSGHPFSTAPFSATSGRAATSWTYTIIGTVLVLSGTAAITKNWFQPQVSYTGLHADGYSTIIRIKVVRPVAGSNLLVLRSTPAATIVHVWYHIRVGKVSRNGLRVQLVPSTYQLISVRGHTYSPVGGLVSGGHSFVTTAPYGLRIPQGGLYSSGSATVTRTLFRGSAGAINCTGKAVAYRYRPVQPFIPREYDPIYTTTGLIEPIIA